MLGVVVGLMVVVVMGVAAYTGMVVGGAAGALDTAPWLRMGVTSFGGGQKDEREEYRERRPETAGAAVCCW
ncbi:hypothetical protein CYMTET_55391 [Cymbomonas tetramitiformis]|uniref:Uncharacterized protein n=1 Tax=Cymbomonas tetramitiformis TaxID=36881 RepID=A0AAE0EN08_9CHLO|nr:hypothetical protein CYMTET_55391 [Cymbomonas tetramitiformis]